MQDVAGHLKRAQALMQAGHLQEATSLYEQVTRQRPQEAPAWQALGWIAFQQGRYEQTVHCLSQVLEAGAGQVEIHLVLGISQQQLRRWSEAIAHYQKVIALTPDCAAAHNNLGVVWMEVGQYNQAVQSCVRAVTLQPERSDYVANLGCAYQHVGDLDLALSCFMKAAQLAPGKPEAFYNWASVLRELNRVDEAIDRLHQALSLNPRFEEARWTLSHLYLLNGQYDLGWQTYDWWRCDLKPVVFPPGCPVVPWDGNDFQGRRLLVLWEQGYGDNLQFLRYLPQVKARGGIVVLETPPEMTALLRGCAGIDEIVPLTVDHRAGYGCDLYTPMLGLSGLFGTVMENVPQMVPYVQADPAKKAIWRSRLQGQGLQIGLVWSGNPVHGNDHRRSCPLELFSALFELQNTRWYSLQKGPAAQQLDPIGPIADWGAWCEDFSDTAAALAVLDLVISVDTSVLHLAGALGRPAWALIPFAPDWRWHLERSDSPWYPTVCLFRQERNGDWVTVLKKLAYSLDRLMRA